MYSSLNQIVICLIPTCLILQLALITSLTIQSHVSTISSWSGILILSIGWKRIYGSLHGKAQVQYGDRPGYSNPLGYNGPLKRWEKYDDEDVDYPRYEPQPVNWIRSKFLKMKNNKSMKPEILPRNSKHYQLFHSQVPQLATTKPLVETKTTEDEDDVVEVTTKTTPKQLLNIIEVTRKNPSPRTTSISRRKTFTHFQTLRGMLVKKTIYEEILEDEHHESLASLATMIFLLLFLLLLLIFLFLGSRNRMKSKICGRKLQNRRHTLLEVVASAKLMGSSGNRSESDLVKGAHKDSNSARDLKRISKKKKLQDLSEERRLVAADDSEEEVTLLVPISKVKDFHHTEA